MQKLKLTKKHGVVVRGFLQGKTSEEIAKKEGVVSQAIFERFKKIKPFLHLKTLARIKDAKKPKPTARDKRIIEMKLAGMSNSEIARAEKINSKYTARNIVNQALKFADASTLKRLSQPLTKSHGDIIRLRLAGKNYAEIARELGYNSNATVRNKLLAALKHLHPRTIERLAIRTRMTPKQITRRRLIVEEFFRQLNKKPHGRGAVAATARRLGEKYGNVKQYLRRAGINHTGEIQRRRLTLALRIQQTMQVPSREVAKELNISQSLVIRYRNYVKSGAHLRGAIELVENPEARQWWDVKLPIVTENPAGPTKINLALRNETVEKDLKLIEQSRKAARNEVALHHPDKPENTGNPKSKFKYNAAMALMVKLKKARQRYVEREVEFRRKYSLPTPEFLKNKG